MKMCQAKMEKQEKFDGIWMEQFLKYGIKIFQQD